jgi:hypothetical protein
VLQDEAESALLDAGDEGGGVGMAGGIGAGFPGELDDLEPIPGSGGRVEPAQGDAGDADRPRSGFRGRTTLGQGSHGDETQQDHDERDN